MKRVMPVSGGNPQNFTMVAASSISKILHEFQCARAESDRLFSILRPEHLYLRPIAERHRVIFYLGHLDGFDSIQICREGLGLASKDVALDALFQAGIDPDGQHLPADTEKDWPALEQVRAYVDRCRERVDEQLERAPEDVVYMALEHRLMHLETLAYMFHNFEYELKDGAAEAQHYGSGESPREQWCLIPAGVATLGKAGDAEFGWDNEYAQTEYGAEEFRIGRYSVTNGDYLRFVQAGAQPPHFWTQRGDQFGLRCMFREITLPLDWPVYVSHAEAKAYAAWQSKSLPTEQQFHRAAYGTPAGKERIYPWASPASGSEQPATRGNFDFRRWDPEPVTATPAGDSAFGVSQLVGNGWQWTDSVFAPLPGFQPRATYPGYSANFFDGEHYVMKGGSPRTAARLLRRSFRNWFRHDYPYMYATFRCVE